MVKVKRNNRLKMGMKARIRHVKLLRLKKEPVLDWLWSQSTEINGLHNKLPAKPGSRWTITLIGQKTDSQPEDDVKEGSVSEQDESGSNENVEDGEDHWDSYENSSLDDNEDYPRDSPLEPTFSIELQNHFVDDSEPAVTPSVDCPLETKTFTIRSLRILGLGPVLEMIEEHISTSPCHNASLKDIVFRGSLDGTTPLLLACHDGDLKTVKYLVENWGVGVNATAVYYKYLKPEPEIEEASPVFVASYNRHFRVVEYLIGRGADLSLKTTSTIQFYHNMTPLLGALRQHLTRAFCYDTCSDDTKPGEVETIVIPLVRLLLENGANPPTLQDGYPIWTGLASKSVNLTTLLVHHGMELNQQNPCNETVLHHWANLRNTNEEDSLNVVKLSVEKGANLMIRDNNGYTPIMTAVASYNWSVVDFLMERDDLDRIEKINAMEMAAAIILNNSPDDFLLERARGCFQRALFLRNEEPNPIFKTPLTLKSGRTIELTTTAQVEAVIQNPNEHKMQSYFALLSMCPGRNFIAGRYMLDSLWGCFYDLLEQRRFDDILDVLWATLDTSRLIGSLPNSARSDIIIGVVKHLLSMMSQLKTDHHLFIADTFKKPLKFILATKLSSSHIGHCGQQEILLQLITFLARNAKILIDDEMKEFLCKLLAQENEESRANVGLKTLLHMACLNPKDVSTIRLLLLSGANPNASDYYHRNGPLHILARRYRRWLVIDDEVVGSAARLLLKYGADLCKVNRKRETAADVWKRENGDLKDLPDWLHEEEVKKLQCHCA